MGRRSEFQRQAASDHLFSFFRRCSLSVVAAPMILEKELILKLITAMISYCCSLPCSSKFLIMLLLMLGHCNAQPKNIFLLAGQSNMSGHGGVLLVNSTWEWDRIVPPECQPKPSIYRFAANLTWEEAREPLHTGIQHTTLGVGPGMPFANTLLQLKPSMESIGLVPCAIGGTALNSWNISGPYYTTLIIRARASTTGGGVIKALLWYQGESDSFNLTDAQTYGERFDKFVNNLRNDLFLPTLPVIQVALASGYTYKDIVRAAQLENRLPNVQCVDALGLQLLPDNMHLTTQSQVLLGEKMARSFLTRRY